MRRFFSAGRSLAAAASDESKIKEERPGALLQCLFHSVVFHHAFEEHLAYPKHVPGEEERILAALQHTWVEYEGAGGVRPPPELQPSADEAAIEEDEAGEFLVPADDLAEAFGEGYGDMSEALALMQDELSQSPNGAAVAVGELMAMLPVTADSDGTAPTPAAAWRLAEEWQVTALPLLAVDLSLQAPTEEESLQLARLWIPHSGEAAADLGPRHRLVALVCFMWGCRHYVAFCRRQQNPSRCIFFNDLPALTSGAPREVEWSSVPELCGRYYLTPRLAFYEDLEHAPPA